MPPIGKADQTTSRHVKCETSHRSNDDDNEDQQAATSATTLQAPEIQKRKSLLDLPTEIIIMCFEWLSRPIDLASSRLVCKTLSHIGEFVMWRHGELKVSITTNSLRKLESISQKEEVARSIGTLTFDLSCYEDNLAKDYCQYTDCLQNRLGRHQSMDFPENERDLTRDERLAYDFINRGAATEWCSFRDARLDNLLRAYYFRFVQRYTDQQVAIQEICTNINKLASLLQQFTNVQIIRITDESTRARWNFGEDHSIVHEMFHDFSLWCFESNKRRLVENYRPQSDLNLWDFERALPAVQEAMQHDYTSICLRRSIWNNRSRESRVPGQMIHVLISIFKALTISPCRPVGLEFSFSPHDSVEATSIAVNELEAATQFMQKVKTVDISTTGHREYIILFYPAFSPNQPAENMTRLMRAVCSNHPELEHLKIGHGRSFWLPNFIYEAELSSFFASKYTNLKSLQVYDLSFCEKRFAKLIESLPATLEKLYLENIKLIGSNKPWNAAKMLLEGLETVRDLDCSWLCGCRYRGSNSHENRICAPPYILGDFGDSRCPSGLWDSETNIPLHHLRT